MPLKRSGRYSTLRGELSARFGASSDEILGPLTFNLGTIQGGSRINIVPDLCEAKIDIRTLPGQDLAPLLDSLAKQFAELSSSDGFWTRSRPTPPTGLSGCLKPAVRRASARLGSVMQPSLPPPDTGGGARTGSMEQAHTADEWISLADLQAGVKFFKTLLRKLANS